MYKDCDLVEIKRTQFGAELKLQTVVLSYEGQFIQGGPVILLTHFVSLFELLQKNVLDENCRE